ncbi:Hunchback-like protein [Armadillidium vulgare]|nr:Hunchback-like protein [Armadillidium vulgare]
MKTNTKEIYKFVCDECGYKANSKSKLTRHKLTHKETLKKEFQCDHCEYKANRKDRLQVHIHTKHKTGQFESVLNRHMRTHNKDKAYRCLECSFKTNYFEQLKKHMQRYHKN